MHVLEATFPFSQLPKRAPRSFSARERAGVGTPMSADPISPTRGPYSTQIPGTATFFTKWGEASALGG